MPRISAPTPMLLIDREQPDADDVDERGDDEHREPDERLHVAAPPIGDGSPSLIWSGQIVDMTRGTVAATAVTVITPAQK